jgi:AcrR family transcriptional regulator
MTAEGDTNPPRQRNPRGTGDRLHGELVEAAVRVLAAHGDTERLSIRAVAAEAQVTPPAVYRCFPDRRALVRTAVETCFDRFETELAQAEQGAAVPFEARRLRRLRHRPAAPVPRHGRRLVGWAQGAG